MADENDALYEAVEKALKSYHNLSALRSAALARMHAIAAHLHPSNTLSPDDTRAVGVRLLLDDCLRELEQDLPGYAQLLRQQFVQELSPLQSAESLHVAPSTIYHRRREALRALTSIVARRELLATERHALRVRAFTETLPPATYSEFVGFEPIVEQIWAALERGAVTPGLPLVLSGLGGIGKTSLARHALVSWLSRYHSAIRKVLFAQVANSPGLGERSPSFELEMILLTLGEQANLPLAALPDNQQRLRRLAAFMAATPTILFIDNIESPGEVELATQLSDGLASSAQLIFTSRREFESVHVKPIRLTELSSEQAARLLQLEADRLELGPLQPDQIQAIYHLVGGHPLALKLVMGQVAHLPLQRALEGLSRASSVTMTLHNHVYERSWALLSELAQWLLVGLTALPPGGGKWEALELAAQAGGFPAETATLQQAVLELTRLNLLQVSPTLPHRYSLHRLTYQFLELKAGIAVRGEE